uniref:Uncharacterized protein n=1 Tax=Arion vulgaris TaxID=1028688 RepID=A0A0B6Z6M5_9EUPU
MHSSISACSFSFNSACLGTNIKTICVSLDLFNTGLRIQKVRLRHPSDIELTTP